ncbi:YihY/virulence factor BrkB family protein [Agromyces sp. SYSU T00194]|uniref:YihY/virulence factor BrkB family protein n=1 Tax=Agromyces chitinivorans TaxID=3158560 RepID=UPI003391A32F
MSDRGNRNGRIAAVPTGSGDPRDEQEEGVGETRGRLEAVTVRLRDRFEEPVSAVTTLTRRTMEIFPVRVWRNFLWRNGFLMSAGMSYMALFAVFAAMFVAFSVAGLWLTGNPEVFTALVELINTYVPGLISADDVEGVIDTDELTRLATQSLSLFTITGVIAVGGLLWTAVSWITYSRIAVRSMFGLARDARAYVLLKARDFVMAIIFGAVLVLTASLSVATTTAFEWVRNVIGLDLASSWTGLVVRLGGLVAVLLLNTAVLATMFRFLSGAAVPWHRLWPGSILGAIALGVVQALGSTVLGAASRNPLLATFTVFIALLLWFNLTSIITLVAASWISVAAADRNETLRRVTPEQLERERRERERNAQLLAARVAVRDAEEDVDAAGFFRRPSARRRLARAEQRLERLQARFDAEDVARLP